jgi:2-oxoglutarate dehydrogenase E2 component (dihydrolipoamide succinyltransferase)
MPTDVVMPQMGESIAEGTITKWLVKVGDSVQRDQPLFEISTDKVDAEIPSPVAGTLLEIKHQAGATVAVNAVVAVIGEGGEQPAAAPAAEQAPAAPAAAPAAPAPAAPAAPPQPAPPSPETPAAAGPQQVAKEEAAREEPRRGEEQRVAQAAQPTAPPAAPAAAAEPAAGPEQELAERVRAYSSPLVRNIARAEGVDLAQVPGTGVHGRVTKEDILGYLEQRKAAAPAAAAAAPPPAAAPAPPPAAAPAPAPAAAPPPAPAATPPPPPGMARPTPWQDFHVPAYREGDNVDIEPMSKIRQITAQHMAYSKHTAAHVTTVFEIDMARVHAVRERAKRGFEKEVGTKLTYMPFIFKAVCAALRANPKLNSSVDGTNVVFKKDINLGMAVALDWGLLVPVIKNADRLSLAGLAQAANDLADRARNKRLKPEEVQGGTFTVTNPGVYGSLFGTPIINQPQVAILGIGTIEKRPVVVSQEGVDAIAIRTMSYFGISYDHRIVDGADADHFMVALKKYLAEETWGELQAYL